VTLVQTALGYACWVTLGLVGLKAFWNAAIPLHMHRRKLREPEWTGGVSLMLEVEAVLVLLAIGLAWAAGGLGPGVAFTAAWGIGLVVGSWVLLFVFGMALGWLSSRNEPPRP